MNTTNPHPKAIALASAFCITAALLIGVSALFASPAAHAGESEVMSRTFASEKIGARPKGTRTPPAAAPGTPSTTPFILFEPQMERVTASR